MNTSHTNFPKSFLAKMETRKSPFAPELAGPELSATDLVRFRNEAVANRISTHIIAKMTGVEVPIKQEEIEVTLPDPKPEAKAEVKTDVEPKETKKSTTKTPKASKKKTPMGAEAFNPHNGAAIDGFCELLQAAILDMTPQEVKKLTWLSGKQLQRLLWDTEYRVRSGAIERLATLPGLTIEGLKSELKERAKYKKSRYQAKYRARQKMLKKETSETQQNYTTASNPERKEENSPMMQAKEETTPAMMKDAEEVKARYVDGGIVLSFEKKFQTEKGLLEYCQALGISEVKFSLK